MLSYFWPEGLQEEPIEARKRQRGRENDGDEGQLQVADEDFVTIHGVRVHGHGHGAQNRERAVECAVRAGTDAGSQKVHRDAGACGDAAADRNQGRHDHTGGAGDDGEKAA